MVESRTVSPEALLEIRANDGEIHDLIMWLDSFDGRVLRMLNEVNPNDYCRNTLLRTDYFEIVALDLDVESDFRNTIQSNLMIIVGILFWGID